MNSLTLLNRFVERADSERIAPSIPILSSSSRKIRRITKEVLPYLIEKAVGEHLAKEHGVTEAVIETPDYDVDICLLRFKKLEIVGEVKWRKKVNEKDIIRAEEVLSEIGAKKGFLFVPDKSKVDSDNLEVIDVSDFKHLE